MKLYHVTTRRAAKSILSHGFRDGSGSYMLESFTLTGVFVSEQPLDSNEGAHGDTVLEIELDVDEHTLDDDELIEEGKPYREWCVPAARLNLGRIRMLGCREVDRMFVERFRASEATAAETLAMREAEALKLLADWEAARE